MIIISVNQGYHNYHHHQCYFYYYYYFINCFYRPKLVCQVYNHIYKPLKEHAYSCYFTALFMCDFVIVRTRYVCTCIVSFFDGNICSQAVDGERH